MFVAWASSLFHEVIARFHIIPENAWVSFADGDDFDLPIFLN
jgi:hypothetical protein